MFRRLSHLIAGWGTGLTRPVLILQAGNALNYFGYGLILPFEIIYLHQIRGFATATAGLVLATILGTAILGTPPSGTLPVSLRAVAHVLDRQSRSVTIAGRGRRARSACAEFRCSGGWWPS